MNNLNVFYPRAMALGLKVQDAGPGFDELEVEAKLGPDRFKKLMQGVEEVFVCNHAHYGKTDSGVAEPTGDDCKTHRLVGYEVHCVYLRDLEKFLTAEVS